MGTNWNEIEIAGLAATTIGIWFLYVQIRDARREFELEHIRQRKLRTFELYDRKRDRLRELHFRIKVKFRQSTDFTPLTGDEARTLREDSDLRKEIIDLLSSLERLAIGIKHDVYDEDTIYQISRTQLISYWSFYERYIELTRDDTPAAYVDFGNLIEKFKEESRKDFKQLPWSHLLQSRRRRRTQ
jgi:hypothetical protein